ncbi:hypothetical protein EDC56_0546 [Sinobacterium caligoides]|uniref:Uncharacterized protein n=1 Tax=Sinobacterium caligoides TaxID=933926 RepID=A0A3N2DYZ7_9GAMM|nr:PA1571 family protein [Sinobacterium caligoides]ROS05024.1 hypothetical protein EDC56_0546 [Sinobacterium caligoides]
MGTDNKTNISSSSQRHSRRDDNVNDKRNNEHDQSRQQKTSFAKKEYPLLDEKYLHHAAIIDEQGNEVEITAQMIDTACNQLIASVPPKKLSSRLRRLLQGYLNRRRIAH